VSRLIAGMMLVMLGACAGDSGNSEEPKGVIPEAQLQSLDKAKGVEQQLIDADEKRRKEMEARGI